MISDIKQRSDGTYVINYGGVPYHATPVETPDVYEQVLALIEGGAEVVPYEEKIEVAPELTKEEIETVRVRAYSDPSTGSDRYFAEAQRMQMMGEEGWEAVLDRGVKRYNEIRAEYPLPV